MKILILGATGAAGGSLLDISLGSPLVTEVRTISRRAVATGSAKHTGFLHDSLSDFSPVSAAFAGLDACFFCLGRAVSLVKNESEYRALAYEAADAAARELHACSPSAAFHYLSGKGASLTSRQLWARVKAESEHNLMENHGAICWRPGVIDAKRTEGWPLFYRFVIPAIRLLAPAKRIYVTGEDLARAMLESASTNGRHRIYENPAIRELADAYRARKIRS